MRPTSDLRVLAYALAQLFLVILISSGCHSPKLDDTVNGTATHAGTARLFLVDDRWPIPAPEPLKTGDDIYNDFKRFVPLRHKLDVDTRGGRTVGENDHFTLRLNAAFIKYLPQSLFGKMGRTIVLISFASKWIKQTEKDASPNEQHYVVFGSEKQTLGSYLDLDDLPIIGPLAAPDPELMIRIVIIQSKEVVKAEMRRTVDMLASMVGAFDPTSTKAAAVAAPVAKMFIGLLADDVIFDHRFTLKRQQNSSWELFANKMQYGTYVIVHQDDFLLKTGFEDEVPQAGYVPNFSSMRYDLHSGRLFKLDWTSNDDKMNKNSGTSIVFKNNWQGTYGGASISYADIPCEETDTTIYDTKKFPKNRDDEFNEYYIKRDERIQAMEELQKSTVKRINTCLKNKYTECSTTFDVIPNYNYVNENTKSQGNNPLPNMKRLENLENILTSFANREKTKETELETEINNTKKNVDRITSQIYAVQKEKEKRIAAYLDLQSEIIKIVPQLGYLTIGVNEKNPGPLHAYKNLKAALISTFYQSKRQKKILDAHIVPLDEHKKPVKKSFESSDRKKCGDYNVKHERYYFNFPAIFFKNVDALLTEYSLHTHLIFSLERAKPANIANEEFGLALQQYIAREAAAASIENQQEIAKKIREITKKNDKKTPPKNEPTSIR